MWTSTAAIRNDDDAYQLSRNLIIANNRNSNSSSSGSRRRQHHHHHHTIDSDDNNNDDDDREDYYYNDDHSYLKLVLGRSTRLTLDGARTIARGIRESNIQQVTITASSHLAHDFVDQVVAILYLEGGHPDIEVANDERAQLVFACLRLRQNDTHFQGFCLFLGSGGGGGNGDDIDIDMDEGEEEEEEEDSIRSFATSLRGNTELKRLELCLEGNDIHEDVVYELATGIRLSKVQDLSICNWNPMVDLTTAHVRILLGQAANNHHHNNNNDNIIPASSSSSSASSRRRRIPLQSLRIDANQGFVDDTAALAKIAAETMPYVKSLSIREVTDLSHKNAFRYFCDGLKRATTPPTPPPIITTTSCHLTSLDLFRCGIDDHSMKMLSMALRKNHRFRLKELHLACNRIGNAGISSFIHDYWHYDKGGSITSGVDDGGNNNNNNNNNNEEKNGLPSLELINLCCNEVGPTGAQQLITTLTAAAVATAAAAAASTQRRGFAVTASKTLNLSGNPIGGYNGNMISSSSSSSSSVCSSSSSSSSSSSNMISSSSSVCSSSSSVCSSSSSSSSCCSSSNCRLVAVVAAASCTGKDWRPAVISPTA